MRRFLVLGVCMIVFGSALVANAGITASYARTVYDGYHGSLDEIAFHVWSIDGAQAGAVLQLMEGTWTVTPPGGGIYLGGYTFNWKTKTTCNLLTSSLAPQSFVNMEAAGGGPPGGWSEFTAPGMYPTLTGGWYTGLMIPKLEAVDTVADGFDATLIAKMYVSTGSDVSFTGQFGFSNDSNLYNYTMKVLDAFWSGMGGTTWSTATGLNNWKDRGVAVVDYANGNDVVFDDTATGLTVDISAADVTPASVLFHNSAKDFLVQGTQGIAGSASLTKQGAGKVTLNSVNTYTGLTTVEAGTLELGLMAQSPVLTGGGADIQGGKIVLDYTGGSTPAATVQVALASSYATGFASGQIYSSTATSKIGLGWIDNGATELTIAYALYGDANLDGFVNATDLNTVLSFRSKWTGDRWNHGDFNYDGFVDATDLNTVLSYYNQSLPSMINVSSYTLDGAAIQALSDAGITVVPEPASLIVLVTGLIGLLAYAWRRRRS